MCALSQPVSHFCMPAVWSSARAASDYTLTFGHTWQSHRRSYDHGPRCIQSKAEEYTDGKLLVDIHEAGSLGGQTVLPKGSHRGYTRMSVVNTEFHPIRRGLQSSDFPHMFPSNASFEKVIILTRSNQADFSSTRK